MRKTGKRVILLGNNREWLAKCHKPETCVGAFETAPHYPLELSMFLRTVFENSAIEIRKKSEQMKLTVRTLPPLSISALL